MTKTTTQEMIDQLNAAEEVMAALDQHAGRVTEMGRAMLTAYWTLDKLRERLPEEWNGDLNPGEVTIYRCQFAAKPYHTDADGPCEVWSTDEVCSLHIQLAEDQMAAREAQ